MPYFRQFIQTNEPIIFGKASSPTPRTHQVPAEVTPERLVPYVLQHSTHFPSKKSLLKALKRGEITIDRQTARKNSWVKGGNTLYIYATQQSPPKVYPRILEVLFEDEYLAAIKKPAGIPVSGNTYQCVENALSFNLAPSEQVDALPWPRPVHRLDRDTTGVLLIAKTAKASVELGRQFQERTIKKTYEALAIGKLPPSGYWTTPITEKDAHTDFELIHQVPSLHGEWLSWVRLYPKTGRTHQLRIHLSKAGFPILGDKLYGKLGLIFKGKGMFLCATRLTFMHPISQKEIDVSVAPPNKFKLHFERTYTRWKKFSE